MSHKKSNSRIHVPFSWEKMPGVPKFMASPMCSLLAGNNRDQAQKKMALPLPPGSFGQLPVTRSSSNRMLSWEEDPFHAAIIECTKDCHDHNCKDNNQETMKMRFQQPRIRIRKCFLSASCKQSFDIEEGSLLIKPSNSAACNIVRRYRV
ncbi:hypothetical protein OSB04_000149 [Centaurea solstitialis]|uniref:Uncharacterized protein n=1 Tax=Centaurea solstitialis TaxID=347529 RepID=A0AA38TW04_9ASTR|nr:hypothetical protein OSB04_000149 [Centaurea solstitialis]